MNIVITGICGLIGSELLRHYIKSQTCKNIYAILRSYSDVSATQRWEKLKYAWSKFFDTSLYDFSKVHIIDYDFLPDNKEIEDLLESSNIDYFFHCAALTNLNLEYKEAYQGNVITTKQAIKVASRLKDLKRFVFFSTAFVSGKKTGMIYEDSTNIFKFNNSYEKTKYEAELLVKASTLPYTILRPTIVVADSNTGYIKGTKVIYAIFKLWTSGFLKKAPISKKGYGDIIPIDFIVKVSSYVVTTDKTLAQTYHLSSGYPPPRGMDIFRVATSTFGMPDPKIAPSWIVPVFVSSWFLRFVPSNLRSIIEQLKFFLPYLNSTKRFYSNDKVVTLLKGTGIKVPQFEEYKTNLFKFVKETFWGKKALNTKIID